MRRSIGQWTICGDGLVTDNVAGQNTNGIVMRQGMAARNVCTYNGFYGLDLDTEVAYAGNTMARNGNLGQVNGGVNLGQNLCGNAVCR
jgi:hypothetical protein